MEGRRLGMAGEILVWRKMSTMDIMSAGNATNFREGMKD